MSIGASLIEKWLGALFEQAGVEIHGEGDSNVQIHDKAKLLKALAHGSLGIGEAFMDGAWSCKRLDVLVCKLAEAGVLHRLRYPVVLPAWLQKASSLVLDQQSIPMSRRVGERHYDLPPIFYQYMLGTSMKYSCALFVEEGMTLEKAQTEAMYWLCNALTLKPGMRVLDIGCGWGSLARFMARLCDVTVVGVTISKEQYAFAQDNVRREGMEDSVDIRLQDYREIADGPFDRVISVGMFEHVGWRHYREFMEHVARLLTEEGLGLLHTIISENTTYGGDRWVRRYIFPGGMLPSWAQVFRSMEGSGLVLQACRNIGPHYAPTLLAWHDNMTRHWEQIVAETQKLAGSEESARFDERLYRMMTFYLLISAGLFKARQLHVGQFVFSKDAFPGSYELPS